ncbi:GntP family permease [Aliifodinibius sp. S!AR15-10]|uniref:GntP family permease n=1 Tax=Aliifodinibius sp. S!AR15-10 TaxID=2950437 RepID=UPI0028611756|nr:GntP family permease [Aliifodinibius sp. S!AR15-10]MDR8389807.1 GntP family permease [Aliifodinibius sp. S!AR15-10]
MVSTPLLITNLIIAVAVILVAIIVFRWSPVVALICGSIYMGLASGLGLVETVGQITEGFGDLMAAVGLSIGFGVIIGQLIYDSGGARSIALKMIDIFPGQLVFYGIGLTAFLFSIPVFFDVTFVILIPLALALVKEIGKPLPYAVGAMVIGAAAAHTLVPPTPNPLAAADILGFDLGIMIIAGLLFGILAVFLSIKILFYFFDLGFWNEEKDQIKEPLETTEEYPQNAPGAIVAVIPIITPILLILSGTACQAFTEQVPGIIQFLSHKVTAMLVGAIMAYVIAGRCMKGKVMTQSVQKAMGSAGLVLLITGAGGSFGAVIESTEIGTTLASGISSFSNSALWAILITYGIALIFRVSQGSGTVASITTMNIMAGASLATTVGLHPVWIALAALSGGMSIGHINDSGFWVTVELSGFSVTGGLKIYTCGEFIISIIVLTLAVLGGTFLPAL